jgi:hypothetical protein
MKKYLILIILSLVTMLFSAKSEEHGDIKKHHIAVFGGVTLLSAEDPITKKDVSHNYPTIGIDYIYNTGMLDNKLGIGVFGEVILEDESNVYILGVPISYNITHSFKAFVAPSMEFAEVEEVEYNEGSAELETSSETESEFLFRIGLAYDFHVGHMSISPTVATDFVGGHQTYILGIALGYGF